MSDSDSPPLPEAGNDPGDPLAPEIEEENSTPDPPLAAPGMDMEVTGTNEIDRDDLNEDGMLSPVNASDDDDLESLLSEVDEAQFEDFDPAALVDRPLPVDETSVRLLGVHKRKRGDGAGGELDEARKRKKREGRREKVKRSRKRRDGSEPFSGGEEIDGKRKTKARAEPSGERRRAVPEVDEESLTPEESTLMMVFVQVH
jgi:transcription factor SPN1